ncbi:MAG: hypothetical protein PQJ46_02685 [Spirochaetales bacterium]|nr:hypothetical protein [Spirochaetales bacterium]
MINFRYKKLVSVILLFFLMVMNLYSFNINKDDFLLTYSMGEYVVAYKNKIYHILDNYGDYEIESVIERPENLINEYGYISIVFKDFTCNVIDLNGTLLTTYKAFAGEIDYAGTLIAQPQVKLVEASSELCENTRQGEIIYKGIYPFYRLAMVRVYGYFIRYNGYPWVPDIKIDKIPTLSVRLDEPVKTISLIPGFLDFERQNLFYENSRIKNIEIINKDNMEKIGEYKLEDKVGFTTIYFNQHIQNFEIRLKEFYKGNKYSDPCLGAIIFIDENSKYLSNYGKGRLEELIESGVFE